MMRVRDLPLALQTEFWLPQFDAEVREHADCIAIRTESNPSFYWGNCLYAAATPQDKDLAHWLARFDALIRQPYNDPTVIAHVAIGFISEPSTEDVLPSWHAQGFEHSETASLSLSEQGALRAAAPIKTQKAVALSPLDFGQHLHALLEVECSDSDGYELQGYRRFRQAQHARHAAMHARGLAQWFGAWHGSELAAVCGLLRNGKQVRFQFVVTHPAHRRLGLCSQLIAYACRWARQHWHNPRFWMMADPHDVAIGIYERLGFERQRSFWSMQRRAPQDAPPQPSQPI